ncbi:MAG: hypothetical protein MUE67_07375, partial [Anaerolineales bacterium]|nr:hypothetical protein [Anaerolineales bacterium]
RLLRASTGAARLTLESGAPVLPVGFFTPPQFARTLGSRMLGRPGHGAWQFGGPSFISIGNTWRPEVDCPVLGAGYQYARVVRGLTDDLMTRINTLVERARAYAATWL